MNCSSIQFDCAEMINMIISAIIGIGLAYFTASTYEQWQHSRRSKQQRERFQPLESNGNTFDWQHWDIVNGKIANDPKDSYTKIKYESDGEFQYEWNESKDGETKGEGHMTFNDRLNGQLYFFTTTKFSYNYRNIFYKEVTHLDKRYHAIFVDASDEGTYYVLMRLA